MNYLEPRKDRVELLSIDALEPGPNQISRSGARLQPQAILGAP
jgi:hypothetical protein